MNIVRLNGIIVSEVLNGVCFCMIWMYSGIVKFMYVLRVIMMNIVYIVVCL